MVVADLFGLTMRTGLPFSSLSTVVALPRGSAIFVGAPKRSISVMDELPLPSVKVANTASGRTKGAGFAGVPTPLAGSINPTISLGETSLIEPSDLVTLTF